MPWVESERDALAVDFRAADADASTLCAGWTARHLCAHLVQPPERARLGLRHLGHSDQNDTRRHPERAPVCGPRGHRVGVVLRAGRNLSAIRVGSHSRFARPDIVQVNTRPGMDHRPIKNESLVSQPRTAMLGLPDKGDSCREEEEAEVVLGEGRPSHRGEARADLKSTAAKRDRWKHRAKKAEASVTELRVQLKAAQKQLKKSSTRAPVVASSSPQEPELMTTLPTASEASTAGNAPTTQSRMPAGRSPSCGPRRADAGSPGCRASRRQNCLRLWADVAASGLPE